ncbi:hypothetical protein ABZV60_21530 [Streptomyces sp. NPDC004787]|uniref:hypothetical protein n=1 Tax=Streptomyces sp. NPDC004787 TaxID=3154291 RepID=UPI0033A3E1D4
MTRFAESDRFEKVWVTANRAAHTAVVRALTGKSRGTIGVSEGTITLDVGATVGQAKVAIGLVITRRYYLDHLPPQVQSEAAAAAVFNHLLHFLRISLRTPIVLSVVVALGAYFIGPGRLARATRSTAERGADSTAGWWGGHGVHSDPVGTWTKAHRRWLDLGTLLLVALLAADGRSGAKPDRA